MQVYSATIITTNKAQPFIANTVTPDRVLRFQSAIAQNRGSNAIYLGDAGVTTTVSLILTAQGSVGATQPLSENADLQDFWVIGTAGDVLVIMAFG